MSYSPSVCECVYVCVRVWGGYRLSQVHCFSNHDINELELFKNGSRVGDAASASGLSIRVRVLVVLPCQWLILSTFMLIIDRALFRLMVLVFHLSTPSMNTF